MILLLAQARWSFDKIFYLEVHHLSADHLSVANCGSTRSLPTPNITVNLNIKT